MQQLQPIPPQYSPRTFQNIEERLRRLERCPCGGGGTTATIAFSPTVNGRMVFNTSAPGYSGVQTVTAADIITVTGTTPFMGAGQIGEPGGPYGLKIQPGTYQVSCIASVYTTATGGSPDASTLTGSRRVQCSVSLMPYPSQSLYPMNFEFVDIDSTTPEARASFNRPFSCTAADMGSDTEVVFDVTGTYYNGVPGDPVVYLEILCTVVAT